MRLFWDFNRHVVIVRLRPCSRDAPAFRGPRRTLPLRQPFDSAQGDKAPARGDKAYQIIYDFKSKPDGATPYATLLRVRRMFYGTTSGGGKNGKGTVFVVSRVGQRARAL